MFKKIEVLEHSKHQNLRLEKIATFNFARNISRVKLSFSEMRQAARFFPIVFSKEAPGIPQALFSIEGNKNVFIDDQGKWKAPYIPFFFRMYPFTLAGIDGQEGQFALCLDPDADHFKSNMGDPLFTIEGKPVEFIEKTILESLKTYQNELQLTQALFGKLAEQEVITDREFKYRVNQEEKSIQGFQGVDMEKLKGLDDQRLAGLVKDGSMGLVYEHLNSMNNFSLLLGQHTNG